jgi:hypothetical protein
MSFYAIAQCKTTQDTVDLFIEGEYVYGRFRGKNYHELPYHIEDSCLAMIKIVSQEFPDTDIHPTEDGINFGLTPGAEIL